MEMHGLKSMWGNILPDTDCRSVNLYKLLKGKIAVNSKSLKNVHYLCFSNFIPENLSYGSS